MALNILKTTLRRSKQFQMFRLSRPLEMRATRRMEGSICILDSKSHWASRTVITILDTRAPGARKIILGDLSFDEMCHFLQWGIHGFLRYCEIERKLLKAAVALTQGRLYVPPGLLERYVDYTQSQRRPAPGGAKPLTLRQKQIAELLSARNTNKEISSALGISENTVKFHLNKLFFRTGVHDRHSIVDSLFAFGQDKNSRPLIGDSEYPGQVATLCIPPKSNEPSKL